MLYVIKYEWEEGEKEERRKAGRKGKSKKTLKTEKRLDASLRMVFWEKK